MKIAGTMLLALAVLGGSPVWAQDAGSQAASVPGKSRYEAMFLFGRADAFRAMLQHRRCDAVDPGAIAAVNQRLQQARVQLAARYGQNFFAAYKAPDDTIPDGICDQMTLDSYSRHVAEIERLLQAAPGG